MNTEIAAALRDIFRIGKVVSTDPETVTARVCFPDADDMVSANLKVAQRNTLKNKDFWMPDIDELVACIFLGNGAIAGFVMFAIYNAEDVPPLTGQDLRYVQFEDETIIKYDRENHELEADVKGDINIKSQTMSAEVEEDYNVESAKVNITNETTNIDASDSCNINCPAVNLGNGAAFGTIHETSPCPIYGVFHLNPSKTVKVAP